MYQGYNKIPLTSSEWKNFNPQSVKFWYVTEKVHGSCFCFIFNCKTKEISYGKRKTILENDETFFGYRNMLPKISEKILLICKTVNEIQPNSEEIHIFGELFGNNVQNGIYYSDDINFYAFDISFVNNTKEIYLDFEESLKIFNKFNILHSTPLAKFLKLEDALNYNYNFQSTIANKLNNKCVENNKAEGIVIRSSNGRYLVKRKIKEFNESQYQNNNYDNTNKSQLELYKTLALKCLTINRLNNAKSKFGEYEKYKESILEELCLDIMTEINGFHIYGLREWLENEISVFVLNKKN